MALIQIFKYLNLLFLFKKGKKYHQQSNKKLRDELIHFLNYYNYRYYD